MTNRSDSWPCVPSCPSITTRPQQLPIVIGSEGTYTLALCEDPDAPDDAAQVFPLQIFATQ